MLKYRDWLVFNMRGDFFDAMVDEWVRCDGLSEPYAFVVDMDMSYCNGGPL